MQSEKRIYARSRGGEADHLGEGLRFLHVTPLRPCPYRAGQVERKLVTPLVGVDAAAAYEPLLHAGFRRSHTAAYQPACPSCTACVSARVRVGDFSPSRSQRRILARNTDLSARVLPPTARADHFALFKRYLEARHTDGEMASMDAADYRAMVEESFVESRVAEFREPDQSLYGVMIFDLVSDGLSAVYSFFKPEREPDSPGTRMILWLIEEARARSLGYVYLGYWIDDCQKMAYKARFRPLETLGPTGWTVLDDDTT